MIRCVAFEEAFPQVPKPKAPFHADKHRSTIPSLGVTGQIGHYQNIVIFAYVPIKQSCRSLAAATNS